MWIQPISLWYLVVWYMYIHTASHVNLHITSIEYYVRTKVFFFFLQKLYRRIMGTKKTESHLHKFVTGSLMALDSKTRESYTRHLYNAMRMAKARVFLVNIARWEGVRTKNTHILLYLIIHCEKYFGKQWSLIKYRYTKEKFYLTSLADIFC